MATKTVLTAARYSKLLTDIRKIIEGGEGTGHAGGSRGNSSRLLAGWRAVDSRKAY